MTYTRKSLILIYTFFLISFLLTPIKSDALVVDGKRCSFVNNSLYEPFSDINGQFPVFGRLINNDGCIPVGSAIDDLFDTAFKVFIMVIILLAVVRISVAGIQWMTQDKSGSKTNARETLTNAVIGLILALSSWLILYTVNPRALNLNLLSLKTGELSSITNLIEQSPATNVVNIEDPVNVGEGGNGGSGGTGGIGGTDGGSDSPSYFTNTGWEEHLRREIESYGLNDLKPKDVARFFPSGTPTTDGWVRLFEEMIVRESRFDPKTTFPESSGNLSVGLFQLSAVDTEVKSLGYNQDDLMDPYKNITAGVAIFKNRMLAANCIACGNSNDAKQSGAAAYWRVLRTADDAGKVEEIVSVLKSSTYVTPPNLPPFPGSN